MTKPIFSSQVDPIMVKGPHFSEQAYQEFSQEYGVSTTSPLPEEKRIQRHPSAGMVPGGKDGLKPPHRGTLALLAGEN